MLVDFLKKFLLLSAEEQRIITHIRADIGRKKEYARGEGFIRIKSPFVKSGQAFVYEPSMDLRMKKLRLTGPYFRVWFTVDADGTAYFVDFEKLGG